MAHFAQINANNVVTQVIVAEQDFINSGVVGDPSTWIQTSYNTKGGQHVLGGTPLRKNYAGIGYSYDPQRDAFIPPKPYSSWQLDEASCTWQAPVPMPADAGQGDPPIYYVWDESNITWQQQTLVV
jgi:hypothetical protein